MASNDVSACLIVRDAEASLPRCLASIAGLVREVIVVDTGSRDATPSVAESLGCRVYRFPWTDDFAAARNESLRHAAGRWVLSLDADEYFDAPNGGKLRDLLASLGDAAAAYTFTQRSLLASGSPLDLLHTRLFRNHPAIRWQYRVHEQIAPSILLLGHTIHPTDVVVEHAGYHDPRLHHQKLERNARLLELEQQQRPDDPYVLFNLGTAYADLGRPAEALRLLRECVRLTPPEFSTSRAAWGALLQCLVRLGQRDEASAVCVEGRRRYPQDVGLLFWQAQLLRDRGDLAGAERCLLELIGRAPGPPSGGVDAALKQYVAPYTLGLVYAAQGRAADAERQWRAVVAEHPIHKPSWQVLAEVYLGQQRWAELETVIGQFEARAEWAADGAVLRARQLLAKQDFGSARAILGRLIERDPGAQAAWYYLAHVLMAEGKDWPAAERALREVLRLDPRQAHAWHNLAVVLRRLDKQPDALEAVATGLRHCPGDPHLSRLDAAMRGGGAKPGPGGRRE
jgi:tetratricopeptide (TPR) repeat protein